VHNKSSDGELMKILLNQLLAIFLMVQFVPVGVLRVVAADDIEKIDCSNPRDQATAGICQARKVEKLDKKMKAIYSNIYREFNKDKRDFLENYQKAWEKYYVTKCFFENIHYGSMFGQMVGVCEEKMIKARIIELNKIKVDYIKYGLIDDNNAITDKQNKSK
jgi:uncharacterized protein YecT (DUF1311 family)